MIEPRDTLSEWQLAVSCLRAEVEAGRKLTPAEMIAAIDDQAKVENFDRAVGE